MRCGLYGKLPAKRDFIALGVPRGVLNAWEPWVQAAVAASRNELGKKWQTVFCAAPIWRFWLGADICGQIVIGAVMPSLDGVGRYFPLTLFACAEGELIAPPERDSHDTWFEAVETLLMSTLDQATEFEAVETALNALQPPRPYCPDAPTPARYVARDGTAAVPLEDRNFGKAFGVLHEQDCTRPYTSCSFWWTIGGEGYAPITLGAKHFPDPTLFSAMLTGVFHQVDHEARFDA
jgi:type VI secretion system protein ImpM